MKPGDKSLTPQARVQRTPEDFFPQSNTNHAQLERIFTHIYNIQSTCTTAEIIQKVLSSWRPLHVRREILRHLQLRIRLIHLLSLGIRAHIVHAAGNV